MVKNKEIAVMPLDGGALCLDYINTVHERKTMPLRDYLLNINDLIDWAEKVKIIDVKKAGALQMKAGLDKKRAAKFFKDALTIRELLHRMFYAISGDKKAAAADLQLYNRYLSQYFPFLQLKHRQGIYRESWALPAESFYWITAPVINDAYELLASDKMNRVKECPNCGWLFLDTTKNGRRRWCSMKSCGSSVKALEWYYRQKTKK